MPQRIIKPAVVACLLVVSAGAQTASQASTTAAVAIPAKEPKAKIIVEPPLAAPLSFGAAVIRYRTEHLQVVPVFGPAALAVSPRLGHVHVSVDDAPWVWANTSGQPVIVQGLSPGRHKVLMQLVNANHQSLDQEAVEFTVPEPLKARSVSRESRQPEVLRQAQPAAKIVIDAPLAEALSRGVVIIPYRTENLQLAPVFGPEALAISPRVGHLHVTVDDAPWHWADASGNQVIVAGLSPGSHKILIELSNPDHQAIDRGTVEVTVPAWNARASTY